MRDVEFYILKEPSKGYELRIGLVPVDVINIPTIQREVSDTLVKRLMGSIDKIGFVEPILLVEGSNGYEVINGQHRLEAAKLLGINEVLAIVLPQEFKSYVISLNIEKAPTLRDKAHQAYEIFMDYLNREPEKREVFLEPMIEEPYYITVGFVIERLNQRFPGYAFEKVLKKVDNFLDVPLGSAKEEREKRADLLLKAGEVLNARYEELGLQNPIQKEVIVSKAFQRVYGKRVRFIDDDYYTAFNKIIEEIPRVSIEEGEEEVEL